MGGKTIRGTRRPFLPMVSLMGLLAMAAVMIDPLRQVAQPQATDIQILNDDGAWCWFQDERALVYGDYLIVGSVANGRYLADRRGDIDLVLYHLPSGKIRRIELHDRLQADDHNAPSLVRLADGRLLAVYAKHGSENRFYYRSTASANDLTNWGPVRDFMPSEASKITYANLIFLAKENAGRGRIYNFFRGLDARNKPSYAWSDDLGNTWTVGNIAIEVPLEFAHRPYVKYTSDGDETIQLLYTEGHPRNYDNGLYHIIYRNGKLHRSDGTPIRRLRDGLARPEDGTQIFAGNPNDVAWCCDLELDEQGRPVAVYSVQKNSAGLAAGHGGMDHRYRYARWDGTQWRDYEIAYAGSRLYPKEDDYTGLICLDPDNLDHVYISTNAHPRTGEPLISKADRRRHYEIFRGATTDQGRTWTWTALTSDSTLDNLRPIVPRWNKRRTVLLWYRGTYHTYESYETEIVARVLGPGDQQPLR